MLPRPPIVVCGERAGCRQHGRNADTHLALRHSGVNNLSRVSDLLGWGDRRGISVLELSPRPETILSFASLGKRLNGNLVDNPSREGRSTSLSDLVGDRRVRA